MSHARALWVLTGLSIAGVVVACSADGLSSSDSERGGPNTGAPGDGGGLPSKAGNDVEQNPQAGAPTSDGVLIVHAASFPAFRLCFSNYMDRAPQPDSRVMPQANVVGVEIGSLVRIDPLETAPGEVYVIREEEVRSLPGDTAKKCSDYIKRVDGSDQGTLLEGNDYIVASGSLDVAVGVNQAEVLAIGGCAPRSLLNRLDGLPNVATPDTTRCGPGWDATYGNATAAVVPLQPTNDRATNDALPVQAYNMAPAISNLGGTVTVKFGETGKPTADLLIGELFKPGQQQILAVNQAEPAMYGQQGFEIRVKLGADEVSQTQTLADVQQLSAPSETPTSYYLAASNYALLLLGDPSHKETVDGGAANKAYNPRRALHLLAVPILDPNKVDAGADASAPDDAGTP